MATGSANPSGRETTCAASAIAYVVFAFADSVLVLFLSRLVQGAGGGTVSVIQAYVADATRPEDRAKLTNPAMQAAFASAIADAAVAWLDERDGVQ